MASGYSRARLLRCAAIAIAHAAIAAHYAVAVAQTPNATTPNAAEPTAYDRAFGEMSADLSDPEKSFAFVQAAVSTGDILGAISTLERILQIDPTLDNIRLELGLLQIQAGRPELGELLIQQALENPSVPLEVRTRADAAVSRASLSNQLNRFAARVFVGAQYDQNPNASPDEVQVIGFSNTGQVTEIKLGGDALSEQVESQWSAVFSGAAEFVHEFDTQDRTELVASAQLYANRYTDRQDLNVIAFSVQGGPRFTLGGDRAGATSLAPYIGGTVLTLDGDKYFESASVGLRTDTYVSRETFVSTQVQTEFRTYENSPPTRPNARDQTGTYVSASANLRQAVGPDWQVSVGGYAEAVNAKGKPSRSGGFLGMLPAAPDYENRVRGEVEVGVARTIPALFGSDGASWRLDGSISARRTEYDQPDPAISLTNAREEDQYGAAIGLFAPITERYALQSRIQYVNNDANLPNFSYENTTFSIGVSARF